MVGLFTHLYLMRRLRMNGATPPLLHVPSCLIEDRDFVFTNFTWHGEVWLVV
jgi:hypothetical protein